MQLQADDKRLGHWPAGDEPVRWPAVDIFGKKYAREAVTIVTLATEPRTFYVKPPGSVVPEPVRIARPKAKDEPHAPTE